MIRTKKPKNKAGRPRKKATDKLTPKEQEFVDLYLKKGELGLHKYQVYMKVYPRTKKYETAVFLAWELCNRPHVKRYIKEIRENVQKKTEIDLGYFTKAYRRLIEFDQRKFYTKSKKLLHVTELDDDTALGLHGLEFGTYSIKKKINGKTRIKTKVYLKNVKLESRKGALDSLRDLLGFNETTQGSPEEFVTGVRTFAEDIESGLPGGKI